MALATMLGTFHSFYTVDFLDKSNTFFYFPLLLVLQYEFVLSIVGS